MSSRSPEKASPLAPPLDPPDELRARFAELEEKAGASAIAIAIDDLETGATFQFHADRWFHAASTIKLAILIGVYGAIHRGELLPQSRVHVRNRFLSAYDGSPYRVRIDRDSNAEVHAEIGRTLRVSELAEQMITSSSNLATNLLLDLVGLDVLQRTLDGFAITGIDLRRGVEDELAFEHGINNRVTAHGLVSLLRLIGEERAFTPDLSRHMLDVLHAQQFRSGIPAGLPREARVAHKTGDISTIAHDAGLVYLPDRKPYALAVLTEWEPSTQGRSATIAAASFLAYSALTGNSE
jgi:beta-lactamase class A